MKKSGFSMLEIIFVVVILGILAGVAIPKFAVSTKKAYITKAKTTINNIRSAVLTIKSEGILTGNSSYPEKLDNLGSTSNDNDNLFDKVLQNPILSSTEDGGWSKTGDNKYTFHLENNDINFSYDKTTGTFNCDSSIELCQELNK